MLITDTAIVYPKHARDIVFRELEGNVFILTSWDSRLHMLNSVGSRIWQLIDGNTHLSEIVQRLCIEYNVSEATAMQETSAFINELQRRNLLIKPDASILPDGT